MISFRRVIEDGSTLTECQSYANPALVYVFSDGLEPIDDILAKHFISNAGIELPSVYRHSKADVNEATKEVYLNSHYKEIFRVLFDKHETAIILEDDLLVGPDFISYFRAMEKVMLDDPSVFAVSAWNDNAFKWTAYPLEPYPLHLQNNTHFAPNSYAFRRQEHFGGLGWMLSNYTYNTRIKPSWSSNWQPWDVIVQNSMLPGDETIYPEVPRVHHAPIINITMDTIHDGETELDGWSYMSLMMSPITKKDYETIDFSHMSTKVYHEMMANDINRAIFIESLDLLPFFDTNKLSEEGLPNCFVVPVPGVSSNSDPMWDPIMKSLDLVGRGNGGAVRGIHRGVVTTNYLGARVFFVGEYSPYSSIELLSKTIRAADTIASQLKYDPSITSARVKSHIFRLKSDTSLHTLVGTANESCTASCAGVNRYCSEMDQVLLLDPLVTQFIFESVCDRVHLATSTRTNTSLNSPPAGYYPLRNNDYSCIVPSTYQFISCIHRPPTLSSRLCVCRQKVLPALPPPAKSLFTA
eukprot:gene6780-7882_t